jgi:CRP/FNR family transcriptional regulator, cyclic AMP receptor protein
VVHLGNSNIAGDDRQHQWPQPAHVYRALIASGIFRRIDGDVAAELLAQLHPVYFPRRTVIFAQDDPGDQLHVIVWGKVKVGYRSPDGRENVLTVMGPSEIFGVISLFDGGRRSFSATALTDVHTVPIEREQLLAWMEDWPEITFQLLRVLARRAEMTSNYLRDILVTDVPCRVAKRLVQLAKRFGIKEGETVRVKHDLSPSEMAQLVGASTDTVAAVLREFADRAWILLEGESIVLRDVRRLLEFPGRQARDA